MASKIAVDEFDVYQKFVNDLERYFRIIDSSITHNVSCKDFVIFIDYNDFSTELIEKIITYIKKRIQMSLIRTVGRFDLQVTCS